MAHRDPVSLPAPTEGGQRPPVRSRSFHEAREAQLFVQALFDGDEEAFEIVLGRYYSVMLQAAMLHETCRARAEEVVEETWLTMLTCLHDRGSGRSLRTEIFRSLIRRARSFGAGERQFMASADAGGPLESGGLSASHVDGANPGHWALVTAGAARDAGAGVRPFSRELRAQRSASLWRRCLPGNGRWWCCVTWKAGPHARCAAGWGSPPPTSGCFCTGRGPGSARWCRLMPPDHSCRTMPPFIGST